jgi:subtilisin family serine protease
MRKHNALLGMVTVILMIGCSKQISKSESDAIGRDPQQLAGQGGGATGEMVPNELLIKFKSGVNTSGRVAAFQRLNAQVQEHILTAAMKQSGDNGGVYLLRVSVNALDAIASAKGLGEIEYAEPNYVYTHDAASNDTYFTNGSLWGMSAGGNVYGSRAASAWANNNTGSNDIYVGIIDEGYMYTHVDLAANAGTNPGEIPGNGVDDDGNTYVDDVYGWDFDGKNNTVFDGTQDDHGCHVAGTIGGAGGNGIGVAGVVWNVKLLNAKFLGRRGGTTANAIKAVDYFTDLKTRHSLNLVATNNSWGGGGFSQGLQDAIGRANTAGILFIAAAGNNSQNIDASASYPAAYPNANIIAVASITSSGAISSFSNYGATKVDLGAPGSSITSTLPGSNGASTYGSYSGTSMACPHVTGAAALYASTHSGASAAAIKGAILSAVTPTPSLSGKCATGGRLNVSTF